jgi:carboxyl-terminal processing protease
VLRRARCGSRASRFADCARFELRRKKTGRKPSRAGERRLYFEAMRILDGLVKVGALVGAFAIASLLAIKLNGGGLWEGLAPAIAAGNPAVVDQKPAPYDLTQLKVVNEVLKTIRDRYVDPKRVKPKEMLLSALDYVQKDVAQVIVTREENNPSKVKIRVDTQEKEFRVDDVVGPWDVSSHLRDAFAFMQDGLRGTDVDLRDVEYAASNGMLHTLDPHSVLLSPDAYKEMNLSTQGQFGGLGIVISIRDQQLTVMNPMPNTPAGRAGLKKFDRIEKINGESTLNMGLNEAVNHLRGTPGSKVTVWIHRDGPEGWQNAKPFELTREVIHVASVDHKLLEGGIGYVRLKQFQANTTADLEAALADMKKTGELKGLVLDLRGNPGGLLDQAAKVVDTFVGDGPIVATVGNPSEGREEKVAHGDGTEPNYPLAVLVNGSSASASEIVTGALKNHERAVVIGDTTFGKGSVQLVFTDLPDKAALKLTIAQYLTEPGDVSIQGVGVTPDIELDPMTADSLEMDLTADSSGVKERDLSRALSNVRAKDGGRPMELLKYDLPIKDRLADRERGGDLDENFELDFAIQFARGFVAHVQPGKRTDEVRQGKQYITDTRRAEVEKVAEELKALGVDWSDAPADVQALAAPAAPAGIDVKIETDRPNNEVTAGDPINLRLTVTNHGTATLYRLFGVTKSENPLFDNKQLGIGKLEPGKSRTVTVPAGWCDFKGHKIGSTAQPAKDAPRQCSVPKDALMRSDGVKVHFEEARGRAPADAELRATVKSLDRPVFAYSYEVIDNRRGNGDGRVQKGEDLTMYLTVKNVGKGRSYETMANLRNLSGEGVLLHDGRFDLSNMMPGDTRRVAFTFDVGQGLADPEAKLELSIHDEDLREGVVEKVHIPIADPMTVASSSGVQRATASGADLVNEPDAQGRVFARLPAGSAAAVAGTSNGYTKLNLGDGRFAFARSSDLEKGGSAPAQVALEDSMGHAPPALELPQPQLVTRDPHTQVHATASDDARLLDAFIFVGARKVFYKSNRNGADPRKMSFDADLPLRPGVNVVTVVARENPDTTTRRTYIVRRDGTNGEILATPKTDDELSETASADDD